MHETRFGIAAALAAGFSLTGALAGTTHYSAEAPAGRDLDNAPRIVDGVVDLGAYEMPLSAQIQFLPETCKFLSGGAFQVSFTGGTNAAYDVWASVDRHALAAGARITGSHGLAQAGPAHDDHPYIITGVLAPTGSVIDRLVVTSVDSVWHVHSSHPTARPEITALLISYATPLAAAMLPRTINATTAMQAASPAYESARLLDLVGVGVQTLQWFALVLMVSAALSLFVALTSALQERRYDLALLRTLGAHPSSLAMLTLAEGVTLLVAGVILGSALGHGATHALGLWLAGSGSWPLTGWMWLPEEALLAAGVVVIGALTCLMPAVQAYFSDPASLLAKR